MIYQVMIFFFQLGTYSHKFSLLILCLAASTSNQRCICDDFETFANQFCCDQYFVGFFLKDSSRMFSFQLMQKVTRFFFFLCGITH